MFFMKVSENKQLLQPGVTEMLKFQSVLYYFQSFRNGTGFNKELIKDLLTQGQKHNDYGYIN